MALTMHYPLKLSMLGSDILMKIFEYDDTYKQTYTNCVNDGNLWSTIWRRWFDSSEDCQRPHIAIAMEWVFMNWGITGDAPLKYFQKSYFPSDIVIYEQEQMEDNVYEVCVYMKHKCELNCLVVRRSYFDEDYRSITFDQESVFAHWDTVFANHEWLVMTRGLDFEDF